MPGHTTTLLGLLAVGLLESSAAGCSRPGASEGEATPTTADHSAFTRLASNGSSTCGLRVDGSLGCWGLRENLPDGTGFSKIGWGWHLCGLDRGGRLGCATASNTDDLAVLPAEPLVDFAESFNHGCGVRAADGSLTCWSRNPENALLSPAGAFVEVVSGAGYSCARTAAGEVTCFGRGAPGPVGRGRYRAIAGGTFGACGLGEDGRLACWDTMRTRLASPPSGEHRAVSCGETHCCAIGIDDTLACWGKQPTDEAPPEGRFKLVLASSGHSCALSLDDEVLCWGRNEFGQLDAPRRGDVHNWGRPTLPGFQAR